MLLVEYNVLSDVKVINEGAGANKKLKVRGKFQKCDEQNNNGRVYPRKVLESQVRAIQEKIGDRSLVGALDHPPNDAIHLSQASHLITKLEVAKNGDVIGEAEILSTPNGKIVEALLNDGVKIGISSRGLGSVSEGEGGKIVNEDFKLITFDLVSDPSTKGAFPELSESLTENSQRAQEIVSRCKKERVFLTLLEDRIDEACANRKKKRKADMLHNDSDEDTVVEGTMGWGKKPGQTPRQKDRQAASDRQQANAGARRAAAKMKTFRKNGVAQTGKQQDLPFKEAKERVFSTIARLIKEKNR